MGFCPPVRPRVQADSRPSIVRSDIRCLALEPDDLGLLVPYLELCVLADSSTYPGRSNRAEGLEARI